MRRRTFGAGAFTLAGAFLIAVLVGCSSGNNKDQGKADAGGGDTDGKTTPSGKQTAVKSGNATIKGKVVLKGDMPDLVKLTSELQEKMKMKPEDLPHCLEMAPAEQKQQQTWDIGDGNGVGNVFVWLTPAPGTYFAIDENHPGVKAATGKPVVLDQPHCAFVPHVLALFPQYKDEAGKTQQTNQEFVVKNSAEISHNVNLKGGPKNPGMNQVLAKGGEVKPSKFSPDNQPITVGCDIHKWMNGYIWVFDHPYYAITDKNGNFEIKNAPVGKVNIVAWHEGHPGNFLKGNKGEAIELKEGDNTKDFEVRAK